MVRLPIYATPLPSTGPVQPASKSIRRSKKKKASKSIRTFTPDTETWARLSARTRTSAAGLAAEGGSPTGRRRDEVGFGSRRCLRRGRRRGVRRRAPRLRLRRLRRSRRAMRRAPLPGAPRQRRGISVGVEGEA